MTRSTGGKVIGSRVNPGVTKCVYIVGDEGDAGVRVALHNDKGGLHSHLFATRIDHHQIGIHRAAADLRCNNAISAQDLAG